MLIPTGYKPRISRDLSYPVGAEIVSEGLQGCSKFEGLKLSFSALGGPAPDAIKQAVASGESMVVLSARYSKYFEPTWNVCVHATLAGKKAAARSVILEEGLALMRDWLDLARNETWLEERRWRFEFSWNPVTGETNSYESRS